MVKNKTVEVGWLIDEDVKATFIYEKPKNVKSERLAPLSKRAIQACPAVNHLERRYFEVKVPFDISLGYEFVNNNHNLYVIEEETRIDNDLINNFVFLMRPELWRNKNTPTIQIRCPYIFLSDEKVYMTQLPPFLSYKNNNLPGLITAGRFPIDLWPRILNYGFEWIDTKKNLKFKRGDPWFYVFFETTNPEDEIKLIEAENTPKLKEYRRGISEVVKYTSNSFGLFDVASERRPKKLLEEKIK